MTSINFVDAQKSNGQPLNALWAAIDGLQAQINNIQLTPGPQGPPGDDGAPGADGDDGAPGADGAGTDDWNNFINVPAGLDNGDQDGLRTYNKNDPLSSIPQQ